MGKPTRSFLAPEVIQSSLMDCGPAALTCVLSGVGVRVSYDRIREACQTSVDGTNIDSLEDVLRGFGVKARQVILPPDSIVDLASTLFPGILVIKTTLSQHFVVAWRRVAGVVQLMDPVMGRRWVKASRLSDEFYLHEQPVNERQLKTMIQYAQYDAWLARSLARLGVAGSFSLVKAALAEPGLLRLAALDAAFRVTRQMIDTRVVPRSAGPGVFARFAQIVAEQPKLAERLIPSELWFIRPSETDSGTAVIRGAVLLTASERGASAQPRRVPAHQALARSLEVEPPNAAREMKQLLERSGRLALLGLCALALAQATGLVAEVLLFRASIELPQLLGVAHQRIVGGVLLVAFFATLLGFEWLRVRGARRLGHLLEIKLRLRTAHRLARLPDQYLRSRPSSDMAERVHALQQVRTFPNFVVSTVGAIVELLLILVAVFVIDVRSGFAALVGSLLYVGLARFALPVMKEVARRVQDIGGALISIYAESLQGIVPVRTHRAENALRAEHESLLAQWVRASDKHIRAGVGVSGGFAGITAMAILSVIAIHVMRSPTREALLLLLFWTQRLPGLMTTVAEAYTAWPMLAARLLRITEPLRQEEDPLMATSAGKLPDGPLSLSLDGVSVRASGAEIVKQLALTVQPGEHIAVVGRSGAGKSTFVSLLLGLHEPAEGTFRICDLPFDSAVVRALREKTVWIDPGVQLWNATLLDNIRYGNEEQEKLPLSDAVDRAELKRVVERLAAGYQTVLGEAGRTVSGGEGQRIRLARAIAAAKPGLVVLDEAFRGLDSDTRARLIETARDLWRDSTLFCVTHDVLATRAFPRVIVFAHGRIVQDGAPETLLAEASGEYAKLVHSAKRVQRIWGARIWKRWTINDGQLEVGG